MSIHKNPFAWAAVLLLLQRCHKCARGGFGGGVLASGQWEMVCGCGKAVKHFTERCSFQWEFALMRSHTTGRKQFSRPVFLALPSPFYFTPFFAFPA